MIKFENTEVVGLEAAIRGMRNPKESWDRSDTISYEYDAFCDTDEELHLANMCNKRCIKIGQNDLKLMHQLIKAGPVHRKFLRMIVVYTDITAGHTFWSEFDTYKVGTVRNSCSKMHKIHVHPFTEDMFDHEGIDACGDWRVSACFKGVIETLEYLREKFNETQEKKYWRAIIELLPMGFHLKATVMLNYEVLANIFKPDNRQFHKLDEWCRHDKKLAGRDYFTDYGFSDWILSLPYSELITGEITNE